MTGPIGLFCSLRGLEGIDKASGWNLEGRNRDSEGERRNETCFDFLLPSFLPLLVSLLHFFFVWDPDDFLSHFFAPSRCLKLVILRSFLPPRPLFVCLLSFQPHRPDIWPPQLMNNFGPCPPEPAKSIRFSFRSYGVVDCRMERYEKNSLVQLNRIGSRFTMHESSYL